MPFKALFLSFRHRLAAGSSLGAALALGLPGCAALEEGFRFTSSPALCYHVETAPPGPFQESAKLELAKRKFTCTLQATDEGERDVLLSGSGNNPALERSLRAKSDPGVQCNMVGNSRICR